MRSVFESEELGYVLGEGNWLAFGSAMASWILQLALCVVLGINALYLLELVHIDLTCWKDLA